MEVYGKATAGLCPNPKHPKMLSVPVRQRIRIKLCFACDAPCKFVNSFFVVV